MELELAPLKPKPTYPNPPDPTKPDPLNDAPITLEERKKGYEGEEHKEGGDRAKKKLWEEKQDKKEEEKHEEEEDEMEMKTRFFLLTGYTTLKGTGRRVGVNPRRQLHRLVNIIRHRVEPVSDDDTERLAI